MATFQQLIPLIIVLTVIVGISMILSLRKYLKRRQPLNLYLFLAAFFFFSVMVNRVLLEINAINLITLETNLKIFMFKYFYAGLATTIVFIWLIKQHVFVDEKKTRQKNVIIYLVFYATFIAILYYDAYIDTADIVTYLMFGWTFVVFFIPTLTYLIECVKLRKLIMNEDEEKAKGIMYIIFSNVFFLGTYLLVIIEELLLFVWDQESLSITAILWVLLACSAVTMYLGYLFPKWVRR